MSNSDYYKDWLDEHEIDGLPRPNDRGLFEWENRVWVLPWLRVYFQWTRCPHKDRADRRYETSKKQGRVAEFCLRCGDRIEGTSRSTKQGVNDIPWHEPPPPPWKKTTWQQIGVVEKPGWTRFLRADQALDLLDTNYDGEDRSEAFRDDVMRLLRSSWVPCVNPSGIDEVNYQQVAHQVVATRLELRENQRACPWNWSRKAGSFPKKMREPVSGIDRVHTPENGRAGLVCYLCHGWSIDENGRLQRDGDAVEDEIDWGPSTRRIPFHRHDKPRRLMLGASMQYRVVPLDPLDESEPPEVRVKQDGWEPPGRNLRVVYSAHDGWTHEDGIVVSESAAERLKSCERAEYRILVPAAAAKTRIEKRGEIERGSPLVQCWIDLFAMGYGLYDAERLGAEKGLIEIQLAQGIARHDEVIDSIDEQPPDEQPPDEQPPTDPSWRKLVIIRTHRIVSLEIGDKLSTRHGIKGVVSRILPDAGMPTTDDGPAEIILSPVGIARRGAMGQFRETCSTAVAATECRQGRIFVSRQPQHARDRWSVRAGVADLRTAENTGQPPPTGQRYGEMEFWALMMHGAEKISRELLSKDRVVQARWMEHESATAPPVQAYRQLATRALNRFLAIIDTKLVAGHIVRPGSSNGSFVIKKRTGAFWIMQSDQKRGNPLGSTIQRYEDLLNDREYFQRQGGLGAIELPRPISLKLHDQDFEFRAVHVIPPWLRPRLPDGKANPITMDYVRLIRSIKQLGFESNEGSSGRTRGLRSVQHCIRQLVENCLGVDFGAEAFLRLSVLGRRLTRSARAVIVPRPDLRIDQVGLPPCITEQLFEGLSKEQRRLVLVNRNPTLHRRGLLALEPVNNGSDDPVIGLPLGVLGPLNADFDGDQACVVALTQEAALEEAERLRPGHGELRLDPFRENRPAFPLLKELEATERELELAQRDDLTQAQWCAEHQLLLTELLGNVGDGWDAVATRKGIEENEEFFNKMPAKEWLEIAAREMRIVYQSVRKKGELGGVLRRMVFRRACSTKKQFYRTIEALGAVTERLSQSALSCKTGEGAREGFSVVKYFKDPIANRDMLDDVDDDHPFDKSVVAAALGDYCEPTGVLEWMARKPKLKSLLKILAAPDNEAAQADPKQDPRLAWFLDLK